MLTRPQTYCITSKSLIPFFLGFFFLNALCAGVLVSNDATMAMFKCRKQVPFTRLHKREITSCRKIETLVLNLHNYWWEDVTEQSCVPYKERGSSLTIQLTFLSHVSLHLRLNSSYIMTKKNCLKINAYCK